MSTSLIRGEKYHTCATSSLMYFMAYMFLRYPAWKQSALIRCTRSDWCYGREVDFGSLFFSGTQSQLTKSIPCFFAVTSSHAFRFRDMHRHYVVCYAVPTNYFEDRFGVRHRATSASGLSAVEHMGVSPLPYVASVITSLS